MKTYLAAFVLGYLATAFAPASAQVLYDNGAPLIGVNGYGYYADVNDPYYTESGNVFTATATGTAATLTFGGMFYNDFLPTGNTFTLSLYSTSGNAPTGTPVTTTLSNLTFTPLGEGDESQEVYEITGTIDTPFLLNAGSQYFLGITDDSDPYGDFAVALSSSLTPGTTNEYSYYTGYSAFVAHTDALSFKLAVPEPGAYALLLTGVVALVLGEEAAPGFRELKVFRT